MAMGEAFYSCANLVVGSEDNGFRLETDDFRNSTLSSRRFRPISTTPYYQQYVGAVGFLLILVGTLLSLIGLLVRVKPQKQT